MMSTNATTTTTATTTTDLSLAACKGDTNVAERKFIDVLVNAHLELQKAEDAVRDNALAIKAAERALQQAQCQKGMVVCNAARKRKAVKEASAHVCDSLKSARQTAFKAGARGAGLFADMAVVRAMSQRLDNDHDDYVDPDASFSTDDEEEEEAELGYHPSSPKFTPITPPGSPNKVSALIGKWEEEEPEPEEEAA